jgi:hypothetical protein
MKLAEQQHRFLLSFSFLKKRFIKMGIRPPEHPAGSAALAGEDGRALRRLHAQLLPLRPRAPHGALGLMPGARSALLCLSR